MAFVGGGRRRYGGRVGFAIPVTGRYTSVTPGGLLFSLDFRVFCGKKCRGITGALHGRYRVVTA